MKAQAPETPCACHSGQPYRSCCAPWHQGENAPTAEQLMRSRYAAYAMGLDDYLLKTWHPATRPAVLKLEDEKSIKWISLQIVRHEDTEPDHALVEFIAKYKINGKAEKLHEISRFICKAGHWLYVDGDFVAS
ncbi:hypothetical protein LG201_05130 [Methylobacillus gramineus]|uniref:YchJ family protein n=1 Tax=Methylobacillus gramineus TaxID=755169 RepID=UPI001CFF87D9|nr:YchJ family metal-binding protein [Methylobacillus gramineus]MCB5184582.1 hypothetical protein [Methylobacillus gramineus]